MTNKAQPIPQMKHCSTEGVSPLGASESMLARPAVQGVPAPRWTYACSVCDWVGSEPVLFGGDIGPFADCPRCGNECTGDEPGFEPVPGRS